MTQVKLKSKLISKKISIGSDLTRPLDWITIPDINDNDQIFYGVYAVYPKGTNYCSLSATCSSGLYHVNLGDGAYGNYVSGTQADHIYNHTTMIDNPDCTAGYKTTIITIIPLTGNLLTLDLQRKNAAITGSTYTGRLLDISINAQYLTNIVSSATPIITLYQLAIFKLNKNSIISFSYLLNKCYSLQLVDINYLTLCTNTSYMFNDCNSLVGVPLFNLENCTNAAYMFNNCNSLTDIPLFNLSNCITTEGMFVYCFSLASVPLFNLESCENTSYMFNKCTSLKRVPLFNLESCINVSNMFKECSALQSCPEFNLTNCNDTSFMFYACYSLVKVPMFNLMNCTNAAYMFTYNYSLTSIPLFNLSNCLDAEHMFSYTFSLTIIPMFNLINCNNTAYMFMNCTSLTQILCAPKKSFSVMNCDMSAEALNDLYTILPVVTGQTLTVTGNPGCNSDTPSIATTKGLTITG